MIFLLRVFAVPSGVPGRLHERVAEVKGGLEDDEDVGDALQPLHVQQLGLKDKAAAAGVYILVVFDACLRVRACLHCVCVSSCVCLFLCVYLCPVVCVL